jgi:hypothetical protein
VTIRPKAERDATMGILNFRYIAFMTVFAVSIFQAGHICLPSTAHAASAEACQTIRENDARLRCFENAASGAANPAATNPKSLEGWRLVRTPNPVGGDDAISIMRTADALRSDPDFAGLTVLCGQQGLEMRVIVIQPFPPRSRPSVTLGRPNSEIHFEASVVSPGAALQLPGEALELAKGPWQSLQELPIRVEQGDTIIRGIIPLRGLGAALQTLMASCSAH